MIKDEIFNNDLVSYYEIDLKEIENYINKFKENILNLENLSIDELENLFPLLKCENIYPFKGINEKDIDEFPNGKARVQFKESIAFGFTYTIASKK